MKKILKWIIYLIAYYPFLKRITSFKNLHFGEDVYIIADSSEIRFMDLSFIKNSKVICYNESFFLKDLLENGNTIYAHLIESFYFFKSYIHQSKKIKIQDLIKILLKSEKIIFFTNLTNILNFFSYKVNYIFSIIPKDEFSKSLFFNSKQFTTGSIKTAITLAQYMGFQKAYIIGLSFHDNSLANHWYDDLPIEAFSKMYKYSPQELLKNDPTLNHFFIEAFKLIELVGITVYKPSQSYLKYLLYEDFTGNRPILRNPHQLTDFSDLLLFNKLERESVKKSDA